MPLTDQLTPQQALVLANISLLNPMPNAVRDALYEHREKGARRRGANREAAAPIALAPRHAVALAVIARQSYNAKNGDECLPIAEALEAPMNERQRAEVATRVQAKPTGRFRPTAMQDRRDAFFAALDRAADSDVAPFSADDLRARAEKLIGRRAPKFPTR